MTGYRNRTSQNNVEISSSNNLPTVGVSSTSKLRDLQKELLIGSFIALGIIIGFWINKQPQTADIPNTIPTPQISDDKASPKPSSSSKVQGFSNSNSLPDSEVPPPRQSLPPSQAEIVTAPQAEVVTIPTPNPTLLTPIPRTAHNSNANPQPSSDWIGRVVGIYQSQIWTENRLVSGTTEFRKTSGNSLYGSYTMNVDNQDESVPGALSQCQASRIHVMRCVWNDKYGSGSLEVTFTENLSSFDGLWGQGSSNPAFQWSGSR